MPSPARKPEARPRMPLGGRRADAVHQARVRASQHRLEAWVPSKKRVLEYLGAALEK